MKDNQEPELICLDQALLATSLGCIGEQQALLATSLGCIGEQQALLATSLGCIGEQQALLATSLVETAISQYILWMFCDLVRKIFY